MSDAQKPADNPPKKMPRKKKEPTGRPRGRPPKRVSFLVPSEVRRTLLAILDEEIDVRTAKGIVRMTNFEAVFRSLVAHAGKGQPTSLIQFVKLVLPALEDRMAAHGQVRVGEFLREQSESPNPFMTACYKDVRMQFNFAKDKY